MVVVEVVVVVVQIQQGNCQNLRLHLIHHQVVEAAVVQVQDKVVLQVQRVVEVEIIIQELLVMQVHLLEVVVVEQVRVLHHKMVVVVMLEEG